MEKNYLSSLTCPYGIKAKIGKKCSKQPAFSLVEMLMALLVASLLLAALAPVVTKKINDHLDITANYHGVNRAFCGIVNDTFEDKNNDDKDCIVPNETYTASAIIVSGGGGGAGAYTSLSSGWLPEGNSSSYMSLLGYKNASTTNEGRNHTIPLEKYVSSIAVTISGGGGGGGGGYGKISGFKPLSQTDCEPFGIFIPAEYNGEGGYNTCVSKYNPGEGRNGSPSLPSTVTPYDAYTSETENLTQCINGWCCFNGETSHDCTTPSGGYSGCGRMVCGWRAADAICKNWKPTSGTYASTGRLPSVAEMKGWEENDKLGNRISKGLGTKGLQLCGSYGSPDIKCVENTQNQNPNNHTHICHIKAPRHNYQQCFPSLLWVDDNTHVWDNYPGEVFPGYSGYATYLIYNQTQSNTHFYAMGARCVVGGGAYTSYIGGGGAGAITVFMYVPQKVIDYLRNHNGGVIKMFAGAGGRGGVGSGNPAVSGSPSRVEIISNSITIWGIETIGGQGGDGANATADLNGAGGIATTATDPKGCKYIQHSVAGGEYNNWTEMSCQNVVNIIHNQYKGEANLTDIAEVRTGENGYDGGYNEASKRGYGGYAEHYDNLKENAPGGTDGKNASTGGGGGSCTQTAYNQFQCKQKDANGNYTINSGGSGGYGQIRLSFRKTLPGAGGSGGGAGAVLHVINLKVNPGEKIKIQAGKRGKGGTAVNGGAGADGGDSFIKIGSTEYRATGGKGGGKAIPGMIGKESGNGGVMVASTLTRPGEPGEGGTVDIKLPGTKINGKAGTKASRVDIDGNLIEEDSDAIIDINKFAGGNGGTNFKTSQYAQIPCGGLNSGTLKMGEAEIKCVPVSGDSGILPLTLTRTLTEKDFSSTFISTLGAGATGGGGGGWDMDASYTGSGASGLGGYVFVYFGGW